VRKYYLLAFTLRQRVWLFFGQMKSNETASRQNNGEPARFPSLFRSFNVWLPTKMILAIVVVHRNGLKCLSRHRKQFNLLTFKVLFQSFSTTKLNKWVLQKKNGFYVKFISFFLELIVDPMKILWKIYVFPVICDTIQKFGICRADINNHYNYRLIAIYF